MRSSLAFLAALAAGANAFKDTSPFLIYSSPPFPNDLSLPSNTLQSASQALQTTKSFLATCPSDTYIFVYQPSTRNEEVGRYTPFINSLASRGGVVSEVLGFSGHEVEQLMLWVEAQCGAVRTALGSAWELAEKTRVMWLEFPTLGEEAVVGGMDREEVFRGHDAMLQAAVGRIGGKYTIIYISTPSNQVPQKQTLEKPIVYEYEAAFNDALHMDLKRDLSARKVKGDRLNSTNSDQRPLFEKYQFFNPGLFMGLLAGVLLVTILSVGISGVSSLQVSYGAFDKEMGPAAHKKAQ